MTTCFTSQTVRMKHLFLYEKLIAVRGTHSFFKLSDVKNSFTLWHSKGEIRSFRWTVVLLTKYAIKLRRQAQMIRATSVYHKTAIIAGVKARVYSLFSFENAWDDK